MFVFTERNESSQWIQDYFPGTRTLPFLNSLIIHQV